MGKSKKSINVGKQLCEHHDEVKCTYFVLLAVKILLRVESMADLKIFAKNNSSNFTLMVAIWVSRTNVTRYSTFLTKAGKWNLCGKSIFIRWFIIQNLKMKTFLNKILYSLPNRCWLVQKIYVFDDSGFSLSSISLLSLSSLNNTHL